jgi:hypothetical protein
MSFIPKRVSLFKQAAFPLVGAAILFAVINEADTEARKEQAKPFKEINPLLRVVEAILYDRETEAITYHSKMLDLFEESKEQRFKNYSEPPRPFSR